MEVSQNNLFYSDNSTAAIFRTLPFTVQLCFDADLLSVVVYTLILMVLRGVARFIKIRRGKKN